MRAVVQRVSRARVEVEGEVVGQIGRGLLVLVGAGPRDTREDAAWLAQKLVGLRIFPDDEGKMNLDVGQVGGGVLVVSQFTLYGDCRKGKRPSFVGAAAPALAEGLVAQVVEEVKALGVPCEAGRFQAEMHVELLNHGPVTLLLDSEKTF